MSSNDLMYTHPKMLRGYLSVSLPGSVNHPRRGLICSILILSSLSGFLLPSARPYNWLVVILGG